MMIGPLMAEHTCFWVSSYKKGHRFPGAQGVARRPPHHHHYRHHRHQDLWKNAASQAPADVLNQKLHFNQIPR